MSLSSWDCQFQAVVVLRLFACTLCLNKLFEVRNMKSLHGFGNRDVTENRAGDEEFF